MKQENDYQKRVDKARKSYGDELNDLMRRLCRSKILDQNIVFGMMATWAVHLLCSAVFLLGDEAKEKFLQDIVKEVLNNPLKKEKQNEHSNHNPR